MDVQSHTTPEKLERYAFLWSLARMVIGAVSLFFGAVPILMGIVGPGLMQLAWLVSGAAAIYLGYRWYTGGQMVFGGKDRKDNIAFWVMVLTGLNLGYTAIGTNVGMSTVYTMTGMMVAGLIFKATALVYLYAAYHLWIRYKAAGERMFGSSTPVQQSIPQAPSGPSSM
jgi:hypothetical protein